jgi:hypothetical protein
LERLLVPKGTGSEADIDKASKKLVSSFYQENPDYFLSPEIFAGVFRQMVRHIASTMEEKWRNAMKRKPKDEKADELRPEYDLGELLKDGVQGKYAGRYREGTNIVLLEPDVAKALRQTKPSTKPFA